ncbi:thiamine phosphate synthase [Weissella confusa]|uniref:thiamine phosphate synthase n=1 Tax=Weissella confusa TaxID=1583 RepID=UPI000E5247A5|nr:thiamine phosphate synthase [Weissella confusa]MBJ7619218.1 thiamine phosphate synthase [Weissella confusa]MBJ7642271.1 thiamine phosphate synthase [Weissella confusa]MBJ7666553.1 thiamine phosphate synthase [Weissella confusa]MBJ7682879.1 thiamine phosphate synthase [Weissella confusa]MBJ7685074.1 thiamine phosphate synthase [Weissella confusa]
MTFKAEQLASTLVIGSQYVDDVAGFVAQAVKAGVSMVILNEAQLTGVEKQNLAEYIRDVTRAADVAFMIADDVALAAAVGADGVYITDRHQVNELTAQAQAADLYTGVSINNRTELLEEEPAGLAFYSVSPVYPSRHVMEESPIEHLAGLTTVVQNSDLPVVAMGGITVARLKDIVRMGVYGAAAIDAFVDADDLVAAVAAFNDTFAGMTVDQALGNTRYGLAIPGKHTNAVQGELH